MLGAGVIGLGLFTPEKATAEVSPAETFFEMRIRPVLAEQCQQCHAKSDAAAESSFHVESRPGLVTEGKQGPIVKPGKPKASHLIDLLRNGHGKIDLPWNSSRQSQITKDFTRWIRDGAQWPSSPSQPSQSSSGEKPGPEWAFEPAEKVTPPDEASEWANNPIDQFVRSKQREHGLKPVQKAEKRTLIRRAYFDLTGLPPSPEAVEEFVNDSSPDAFDKVIDRLLASPRYGERWGRHWLDLARYADTSGDASDTPVPEARLYRNYVIDAFNQDIPYDQFIIEQIAGDRLAFKRSSQRWREQIIATGFVALSRQFGNRAYADRHMIIQNTLDTIGKSMLGMTLACARCHDHKFDPISNEDYYGLYGYFDSTRYPHAGTEHTPARTNFVPLTQDDQVFQKFLQWDDKRFKLTKKLKGGDGDREKIKEKLKALEKERPKVDLAWAVIDKPGKTGNSRLQKSGNPHNKGKKIRRGFIERITSGPADIPEGQSGRLRLARWIASPENPLTARVMVNRIWQYHFGKGIVPTSSTFGAQGKKPSHPDLLDWLARRFIKEDWSIKAMHRLIMQSKTYQLSSKAAHPKGRQTDPNNKWYWHYERRRLEAEPIRDAILAVSGTLDRSRPGPHPFPEPRRWGRVRFTQHHPFTEDYFHNHRTVYLMTRRLGMHPFLKMFNGPNTNQSTARRRVSTVPLQALFWMNSDFVHKKSDAFADRLLATDLKTSERIKRAYRIAYGRPPSAKEQRQFQDYLQQYQSRLEQSDSKANARRQAWASFCRILLASNEFLYLQ